MATKWDKVPSLNEDVGRGVSEDAGKVKKAFTSTAKGAAKDAVKNAGIRAGSRLASRASLAGTAAQLGWDVGRAVDKTTGIGKKIVDSTVGDDIESSITRGHGDENLSADTKRRLKDGEAGGGRGKVNPPNARDAGGGRGFVNPETPKAAKSSPKAAKPTAKADAPMSSVREGRNANIDDETRKRAMASVGLKAGGSVRGWGGARGGKSCKMR